MKLDEFKLEVYFSKYEFTAPYLLCSSDCEAMTVDALLAFEPNAKEEFLNTWLGYTESPGDPEVLSLAAGLYETVTPDDILEHVGAQEALFNFQNAVLSPGDHVIAMFPNYESAYSVSENIGCAVSHWNLRQKPEGGWEICLDELEKLIKPNTKAMMLNTPNNPTGYRLSLEEMKSITEMARNRNIIVFSDEVYRGLNFIGKEPPAFADLYENAVSLNVLSKSFGLPGLRIGWIATRNREIRRSMALYKHYTTICSPSPSQFLARIALTHREPILARNRKIITDNLALAEAFFQNHRDRFLCNKPMGGSIAFHRLNGNRPIGEVVNDLVEKKGVLLLPGDVYDHGGNYFRMGYGRSNFSKAMELFAEYVEEDVE